ncbi:freyrasin family ranthipeptide [Kitasatospora sp. NPDC091257]|uniref:freyrasin family ranthipeptide n=1 Tax=Kitasatospora sp. NPDC091257 TaxID=3364084 RepID=UPI00382549DA
MSGKNQEGSAPERRRLLKKANFSDEVERRGTTEVRNELGVPDLDQVLKDLQQRYGIRIGLSPNLIDRLEAIKARSANDPILRSGCYTQDVCVFCDTGDLCVTCDMMDWCISVDVH